MAGVPLGTLIRLAQRTALALILTAWVAGAAPKAPAQPPPRTDFYGDPLPAGAVARMGTIQLRHTCANVVFAADGKTLLSCGQDGTVRHWDLATGKEVRHKRLWRTEKDRQRFLNSVLAPDGRIVAAWEKDTVYLHDAATGEERGRLPVGPAAGAWMTFSPGAKALAVRTLDERGRAGFQLWDVPGRRKRPGFDGKIEPWGDPVFSPDGKLLAAKTSDGGLHLWDAATGKELRSARAEGLGLAFSPDGKTLATTGFSDGKVRLWETATLKERAAIQVPDDMKESAGHLAFSPDGKLLATAGPRGVILWDTATREERRRLPDRTAMTVQNLAFAPDAQTLVCWGGGNEIRLWDIASGRQLHPRPAHASLIETLAVSPDGKILASGGLHDPTVRLWDARTGKPLQSLKGHDPWVCTCAFSADGKRVVSGGNQGTFQVWDAATGAELRRFEIEVPPGGSRLSLDVRPARFSPDGKRLAAVSVDHGFPRDFLAQVHVWDTATGKLLARRPYKIDAHTRATPNGGTTSWVEIHAAFTPDGEGVTVRLGKGLGIEDTLTGRVLATLPEGIGRLVAFSPDGRLVAAALLKAKQDPFEGYQIEGISLIESATGREVLRVKSGEGHLLAFAPDGRSFALVDNRAIYVWDVATGMQLLHRPWPESLVSRRGFVSVCSLVFLPHGRTLATGMNDGAILVWDLEPQTWPKTAPAKELDPRQLAALWADLAGDARQAHRAVHALAAAPAQAVPFLKDRLRPAAAVEAKRLEKLVADLDSDRFAVREAAVKEITQLGERVEPALRRLLEDKPSLEVRRRVRAILAGPRPIPPAEVLRVLRAIGVLERAGTPEARQVLRKLAEGAAARQTREAKAALERLARPTRPEH